MFWNNSHSPMWSPFSIPSKSLSKVNISHTPRRWNLKSHFHSRSLLPFIIYHFLYSTQVYIYIYISMVLSPKALHINIHATHTHTHIHTPYTQICRYNRHLLQKPKVKRATPSIFVTIFVAELRDDTILTIFWF